MGLVWAYQKEVPWRGWNFGDCGYGVGEGRFDAILWVPGKPVPKGVCCIGCYCGLTRKKHSYWYRNWGKTRIIRAILLILSNETNERIYTSRDTIRLVIPE
jgi:hypothetical protein